MISIVQLGSIDYATGLRLQEKLVSLRKAGEISDTLLLLEHTPVITLGRNAKEHNIVAPREFLAGRGVEVFECNRGGDVTFHGPGQLVGYPIFDLRDQRDREGQRRSMGAVEFVRNIEEALIRTCADFGIHTERVPGLTGVWTVPNAPTDQSAQSPASTFAPTGQSPVSTLSEQGKVAAIGVHISRGVTSHGFAFNVTTDLDYFKLIVPCGISTKPVTSVEKELGTAPSWDEIVQSTVRNFGRVFNSQVLWVESIDDLVGHNVGVPMRAPEELRKLHGDDIQLA
jgi:lipoyl(octanoyl) transferase